MIYNLPRLQRRKMDNSKRKQIEKTRIPPFNKTIALSVQLMRDILPELDDYWFIVDFGYYAKQKEKKC